jgi:hypothetical protein
MLEELFITLPELPTPDLVEEYVEKHTHSNAPQRTLPRWAAVCLVLGGMLSVGAGAFLITLWWMQ